MGPGTTPPRPPLPASSNDSNVVSDNSSMQQYVPRSYYNEASERDYTFWGRFKRRTGEVPWFPIGFAGFLGIAGYGMVNYFRNREKYQDGTSRTIYFTRLRVMAQGFAVAIITIGFIQHQIQEWNNERKSSVTSASSSSLPASPPSYTQAPGVAVAAASVKQQPRILTQEQSAIVPTTHNPRTSRSS